MEILVLGNRTTRDINAHSLHCLHIRHSLRNLDESLAFVLARALRALTPLSPQTSFVAALITSQDLGQLVSQTACVRKSAACGFVKAMIKVSSLLAF